MLIGEGNGNPRQYSFLETPVGGGAWWATLHGVPQSWTRLKRLQFSSVQFSRSVVKRLSSSLLENSTNYCEWTKSLSPLICCFFFLSSPSIYVYCNSDVETTMYQWGTSFSGSLAHVNLIYWKGITYYFSHMRNFYYGLKYYFLSCS